MTKKRSKVQNSRSRVLQRPKYTRHPPQLRLDDSSAAKVREDNPASIRKRRHEYVIRLQVAVDNILVMEVVQSHQNLSHDNGSFDIAEPAAFVLDE